MNNITTMTARGSSKVAKQAPETVLATIEKSGNYISHCRDVLALKPFDEFWTNDSTAKIESRLDHNRQILARVPSLAEVEQFVKIIGHALECGTEAVLKRQIGLLLGAFPNVALPNADTFVELLMHDINDGGYSDAIVFLTCRDLRRKGKFFPTIAEILSTAEGHDSHWRQALDLPKLMITKRQELEAAVAKAERCLDQARAGVADGWRDEEGNLLGPRIPKLLNRGTT